MPFLKKAAREEDDVDISEQMEEQYMRLFPKLGRDFIHRNDFINIMQQVLEMIDPDGINPISLSDDSEARERAREYKGFLESNIQGSKFYKDLIVLDEDDE